MKAGNGEKRVDGRSQGQLRPLRITTGNNPYAEGSAEVQLGSTRLLITATIDESDTNDEIEQEEGRIYASLSMLPRSMHVRIKDTDLTDVVKHELTSLQQLIVRALRAAVNPEEIANLTITLDCTIVCSDAGIASAAVAGSWVALYQSLRWAAIQKMVNEDLYITRVAAVSGGIVNNQVLIDLCAEEAADAEFTANLVFDEHNKLVDVRGTQEKSAIELPTYISLLESASKQVSTIFVEQERAVLEME